MSGIYEEIKKDFSDNIWTVCRVGGYTLILAIGAKKVVGMPYPMVGKLTVSDLGKFFGYLSLAVLFDDYALDKKWYSEKISK